jgi:hypothetical protein
VLRREGQGPVLLAECDDVADVILFGDYTGHSFFTERPDFVAIEIAQSVADEARRRIGRRSQPKRNSASASSGGYTNIESIYRSNDLSIYLAPAVMVGATDRYIALKKNL